jgi:hypothetical protein
MGEMSFSSASVPAPRAALLVRLSALAVDSLGASVFD